jgi:hypothetical protein
VTKLVNNLALPLELFNASVEKGREYFEKRFANDFAAEIARIAPDSIIEPEAIISVPVLQGLALSHEDKALRDMYLGLLASAMDARSKASAHPSYVDIIRQLTPDEARLVQSMLKHVSIPYVEVNVLAHWYGPWAIRKEFRTEITYLLESKYVEPDSVERMRTMLDNLLRLKLFEEHGSSFLQDSEYSWLETNAALIRVRQEHGRRVYLKKGFLGRTNYGYMFARAVGVFHPPAAPTPTA